MERDGVEVNRYNRNIMPTESEIIKELLSTIDSSIEQFNKSMPGIQSDILSSILELSKELTMPARSVKQQVANLQLIGKIKYKINDLVLSPEYISNVKTFAKSFDKVTSIQNKYFNKIVADDYASKTLLKEIKISYIDNAIESLTEAGIDTISSNIKDILLRNVTSGGSYSSMVKEVSGYLTDGEGELTKYARQITTDALNQYSASYTKAVTDDLGLTWFRYVGSLISTSRPFCKELVAKDYVHKSELPTIVKGVIDGKQVPLGKNGLPSGMIEGTTAQNFMVNRGGWRCQHQLYPVSEFSVPQELRDKFKSD